MPYGSGPSTSPEGSARSFPLSVASNEVGIGPPLLAIRIRLPAMYGIDAKIAARSVWGVGYATGVGWGMIGCVIAGWSAATGADVVGWTRATTTTATTAAAPSTIASAAMGRTPTVDVGLVRGRCPGRECTPPEAYGNVCASSCCQSRGPSPAATVIPPVIGRSRFYQTARSIGEASLPPVVGGRKDYGAAGWPTDVPATWMLPELVSWMPISPPTRIPAAAPMTTPNTIAPASFGFSAACTAAPETDTKFISPRE